MNPPVSSLVRLRLAQVLMRRYSMGVDPSIRLANELIGLLRGVNLDVVFSDWLNGDQVAKKDFWAGVAELHDRMDSDGYTPWKPQ